MSSSPRRLAMAQWDVFTSRPLQGNSLAVFFDGRGLTDGELPFAGHPTLGTAFALRSQSGAERVVLELNAGKVPVEFEDNPGESPFGEMTQLDPTFGIQHEREAV